MLKNHNKLLWMLEGADGVKTGYTKAAGRILVSSATREGRRLVCVTLNAGDDWNDHITLLEEGFSRYELKRIVSAGEILGSVEIAGGEAGKAELLAAEDFEYPVAEEDAVSLHFTGPGFVYAPVAEGAEAGFAHICIDGKSVKKLPLIYGETVEQIPEKEKSFWDKLTGGE